MAVPAFLLKHVGREKLQAWLYAGLGIALFLAGWQAIGHYRVFGTTWPPFTDTVAYVFDDARRGLYQRAWKATLTKAAGGYVLGAFLGLAIAALVHNIRLLRPGLDRLSSFVHAIPPIALAPIFMVLLNRDYVGMAIATLNVYFTVYISATSGLMNSSRAHRDLFTSLGASRWRRLASLDLPAALPPVVTGLKTAVTSALIGSLIGEWFGASRGLGVLMVSAMQNYQITLLWGAVLIVASVALVLYGLSTLLERIVYGRFT